MAWCLQTSREHGCKPAAPSLASLPHSPHSTPCSYNESLALLASPCCCFWGWLYRLVAVGGSHVGAERRLEAARRKLAVYERHPLEPTGATGEAGRRNAGAAPPNHKTAAAAAAGTHCAHASAAEADSISQLRIPKLAVTFSLPSSDPPPCQTLRW